MQTTDTDIIQSMEHFITLARRGRPGSGASGGEVRARKLAIAIIEFGQLDDQALAGAAQFLKRAYLLTPSEAREMIGA